MNYIILDVYKMNDTNNFNGTEWIVDGELGRMCYPGDWEKSKACTYYARGWLHTHKEVA